MTTFAAGLTWARLLQEDYGIAVGLKWPNDLLAAECKLSGMLSEMEARGDLLTFVNIGIGLNVNNAPIAPEQGAISLSQLAGHPLSRRELLENFLDRFEALMKDAGGLNHVIREWKAYALTLNRQVKIVTIRETIAGMARDVDETGALILERADGSRQRILHGDCFHLAGADDKD